MGQVLGGTSDNLVRRVAEIRALQGPMSVFVLEVVPLSRLGRWCCGSLVGFRGKLSVSQLKPALSQTVLGIRVSTSTLLMVGGCTN